jgi:hypothetical protein
MKTTSFQLEERMGGGRWARVYQTKEEANYEMPSYVSFSTAEEAARYASDSGRWSSDAIERGVVRLLKVETSVENVEWP